MNQLSDLGMHATQLPQILNYAQLLIREGQHQEAIRQLQRVLRVSHEQDLNTYTAKAYEELSKAHLLSGAQEQALIYLERANRLNNHIMRGDRLRKIDEMEIRYRTAEKEKQLTLAENQNLLQSQRLVQQKWIITLLTLGILSTLLTTRTIMQKRRMARLKLEMKHQQELDQAQKEKELAEMQALFSGQERERKRIATDLHDSLGGTLYALQLQLSNSKAPEEQRRTLQHALAENRRISENLLPPTLTQIGLGAALQEWSEEFRSTWSIPVDLYLEDTSYGMTEEARISLFRIVQELMNNVARHAAANQVIVQLYKTKHSVQLMVEDDGQGFDTTSTDELFLKTVSSRTRLLHGKLQVDSSPEKGTTVIVEVPLKSVSPLT